MNNNMTDRDKLNCYDLVNSVETFDKLKDTILLIGSMNNGVIPGSVRDFDATKMANNVDKIRTGKYSYNGLTRSFGIRQQAIYLHTYGEN